MTLPQFEAVASNCTIDAAAAVVAGRQPETVLEVARQLVAIAGIVDGNYPGDSRIARELLDIAAVLTARVQAQS